MRPHGVGGHGSRGWDVSSSVSVGTVVMAQMEEWGGAQEAAEFGTKVCNRGGIICGNHCGTRLMDAVAATRSVVVVAVLAAFLRSPAWKY